MPSIRNISVGLPVRDGHVLAIVGFDGVKKETFYRVIGGGIEFGETAEVALRREFSEEMGVSLGQVELLDVVENIFEFEGSPGHEIAHVFAVESPEINAIPLDTQLHVLDEGSPITWVRIDAIAHPLYPETVLHLLETLLSNRADARDDPGLL